MEAVRKEELLKTITVTMTEQEASNLAYTLSEAIWGLQQPQADGYPFNWKGDPNDMKKLYNAIKRPDWGEIL